MRFLCLFFAASLLGFESATGLDADYREACLKAATDPVYFRHFRSMNDYAHAVEIGFNGAFGIYLEQYALPSTLEKLDAFRKLDSLGRPPLFEFPGAGSFSGTTIRYIVIADQIARLFSLPQHPLVAEIGAGFGGQCYILFHALSYARYWIYDLPETERLIEKIVSELAIPNAVCLPIDAELPEERVDLLISNYAFSECDREMQLDYFERVVKRADRGYFLYNRSTGDVDAMTPEEFVHLLEESRMRPLLLPEPICTYGGNVLIIWDRT